MSKRLAQLFDRAADHLEKYGWMKDDFFPGAVDAKSKPGESHHDFVKRGAKRKPCCALGVMHAVAKDSTEFAVMQSTFETVVPSIRNGTYISIWEWNDVKSRRKADVVRAFRRAAEAQRNAS